jgi:hypothetical protein
MKKKWFYFKSWLCLEVGKLTNQNPYKLVPSGFCPVQIEGYTKEGQWFYFRSRGNTITFVISKEEDYGHEEPLFEKTLIYGSHPFVAGWLPHEDAIRLTTVWLNEWYNK